MKKIITLSATILASVALMTPVSSVQADELVQPALTTLAIGQHGGGHGGGHHGGGHHGGGVKSGGVKSSGSVKSGTPKSGGSVKSGTPKTSTPKSGDSVKSNNSKTGKDVKVIDRSDKTDTTKPKSSTTKTDKSSSSKTTQKTTPKLNKSEKSTFNDGGKVKDTKTLKKFAEQSDVKDANKNASRIFSSNGYDNTTYNVYRHQSVFDNPWFWMYMMNHNRSRYGYNSEAYTKNSESEFYLRGYKDGYNDGEKGEDNIKKLSDTKDVKGKFSNETEKSEYLKGYKDGLADAKSEK